MKFNDALDKVGEDQGLDEEEKEKLTEKYFAICDSGDQEDEESLGDFDEVEDDFDLDGGVDIFGGDSL